MKQMILDVRRRNTVVLAGTAIVGLAGASVAVAPGVAGAATGARPATVCVHAKHRFVEALSGAVSGKTVTVKAHPATFHCGGDDDGHYNVAKKTETLTIDPKAVIKVFKKPVDPSKGTKVISPSALPHWLKANKDEPIYQVAGSVSDTTNLKQQFVP